MSIAKWMDSLSYNELPNEIFLSDKLTRFDSNNVIYFDNFHEINIQGLEILLFSLDSNQISIE